MLYHESPVNYFYPLRVLFPAGVHSWCWVRRQETREKGHQASPGSQWTTAGPCGYRDRRHSIYHNTIATAWGQCNMGLSGSICSFMSIQICEMASVCVCMWVSSSQVVFVYAWWEVFPLACHTVLPPNIKWLMSGSCTFKKKLVQAHPLTVILTWVILNDNHHPCLIQGL